MSDKVFYVLRLDPDGELDTEWIFNSQEDLNIAMAAVEKSGVDFEAESEGVTYAKGEDVAAFIRDVFGIALEPDEPSDGFLDSMADADALASAGMGTDEDYGYFGGEE